eukprot:3338928-Lingulodinium_polyedra.AAC.1
MLRVILCVAGASLVPATLPWPLRLPMSALRRISAASKGSKALGLCPLCPGHSQLGDQGSQ